MIKDEFVERFGAIGYDARMLEAARWGMERSANIANHYMADQTDPAKSVAASDIKILIRQMAKEME